MDDVTASTATDINAAVPVANEVPKKDKKNKKNKKTKKTKKVEKAGQPEPVTAANAGAFVDVSTIAVPISLEQRRILLEAAIGNVNGEDLEKLRDILVNPVINAKLDQLLWFRMPKSVREGAVTMSHDEVRYGVREFYAMQQQRIRAHNRVRRLEAEKVPHEVTVWLAQKSRVLELQIGKALETFGMARPLGQWAMSNCGVGPLLTAGLIAYTTVSAPTVGHVWRFAGLDPTSIWYGKEGAENFIAQYWPKGLRRCTPELAATLAVESHRTPARVQMAIAGTGEKAALNRLDTVKWFSRRPWNADFKLLCWKISQSFLKVCNKPEAVYGHLIMSRRAYEIANNDNGMYASQAAEILKKKKTLSTESDAYMWYSGQVTKEEAIRYRLAVEEAKIATKERRTAAKLLDEDPENPDLAIDRDTPEGVPAAQAEYLSKSIKRVEPGQGVMMLPPAHILSRSLRWGVKRFLYDFWAVGHYMELGVVGPAPWVVTHGGHTDFMPPPHMDMVPGMTDAWMAMHGPARRM